MVEPSRLKQAAKPANQEHADKAFEQLAEPFRREIKWHCYRMLWDSFTLHYTPTHGSWLNQAEIEFSLFARQCLGRRRIPSLPQLQREANMSTTTDWPNSIRPYR